MEKILWLVLELSYAGTWIIAAVMLLRCLLHRLPKKFSYVLWIIPGIRLLFPVSFPGIWGLSGNWNAVKEGFMIPQAVKEVQNAVNTGREAGGIRLAKEVFAGMQPECFISGVLRQAAIVWVAGMVLFSGYVLFSIVRLKRKLRISVRWKENIYLADGILTPFVLVGFPDKIYLPSDLKKEECRYILMHEQFHIKRKDSLFKLLACLILCIHWFNPVVWIGVSFFSRDMEMSCDEAVAAKLDRNGKREYAKELLRFSVNQKQRFLCSVGFGEKGVRGRIMNLFQKKSKSKGAIILGTSLVILAGVVLLPDFLGQDLEHTVFKEVKAEETAKEKLTGLIEKSDREEGREYGYPTKIYQYGEVTGDYEAGQAEPADDEVRTQLLWLDELGKIAKKDFKKEYPDCVLEGWFYDCELSERIAMLSSANGTKEVLQLKVLLPEDWKEKESYSSMDGRKQTVNWMLVQGEDGAWKTLGQSWYDME